MRRPRRKGTALNRLKRSFTHWLLTSRATGLFGSERFLSWKLRGLERAFALARARSAADDALCCGIDLYLEQLGSTARLTSRQRRRLRGVIRRNDEFTRRLASVLKDWERAFWSGESPRTFGADDLVGLESERRTWSSRRLKGARRFGFLYRAGAVPPIRFNVPLPAEVAERWSSELANPAPLFAAPEVMPEVEVSQPVAGPVGREYFVRFESPSAFAADTVYARVYEAENGPARLPTLIFGSGMGEVYDQLDYWPEEDFAGRGLSAQGVRVVLIETPWHGRRELPGSASGEPYLASAPVSLMELFSAQVQETSILVRWARERGASRVVVGGFSLGGIVAQQVAGRCGAWLEAARPDAAVLAATSGRIDRVLVGSEISRLLGVSEALKAAGWTDDELAALRPILDPPAEPGLAPDRIFAFLGGRDRTTPYRFARELLAGWRVPDANVVTRNAGHVGLLVHAIRKPDLRRLLLRALRGGPEPKM